MAAGSSLTFRESFSVSFPFPLSFLGLPLPFETSGGGTWDVKDSSKAGAEVARDTEGSSE